MRQRKPLIFILLATLLFSGCVKNGTSSDKSTALNNSSSANGNKATSGKNTTQTAMADFFLPDGSKAHFEGEGNEFAELDIEVARLIENYVVIHENNGGSIVRYVYKIEEDTIQVLDNITVGTKKDVPSKEEMDAMKPIGIYLKMPFEKGVSFDKWTIIDIDATVETPYKKFEHAIVIEMKDKDFVNRKYLVEGYGEVKRESVMQVEGEEDFVVTSKLKLVDK
ncbi:hypothetical protein [Sporosarcina limicola]|uniref:Lipoprotein n=1 Tax=Sporosarcina limicola TaxID=34101 RepID=A0A927MKS2_9BACL|nr:hypothetical protein [Sporosarcina limicola]MBE1554757.1 hypothetical protein [Sporosarcina limicola]